MLLFAFILVLTDAFTDCRDRLQILLCTMAYLSHINHLELGYFFVLGYSGVVHKIHDPNSSTPGTHWHDYITTGAVGVNFFAYATVYATILFCKI